MSDLNIPSSVDTFIEYRVIPVTRYHVARFSRSLTPCRTGEMVECQGSDTKGEFDNFSVAHEVAYALAKADHDRMGWPIDDERIRYPEPPPTPKVPAR